MTRREQLQEQFEDALFALLIEDAKRAHNEQAAALHEQLKQSNKIQISPEFNERMRAFIRQNCPRKRRPIRVNFPKLVSRVAVAACFTILITSTAFATFPDLKTNLMNVWLEITEESIDFHFADSDQYDINSTDSLSIGWIPDGFFLESTEEMNDILSYKYTHENDDSKYIEIIKYTNTSTTLTVDTENATQEKFQINGEHSLLVQKTVDEIDYLTLIIENQTNHFLIEIIANEISKDEIIKLAENIQCTQSMEVLS